MLDAVLLPAFFLPGQVSRISYRRLEEVTDHSLSPFGMAKGLVQVVRADKMRGTTADLR